METMLIPVCIIYLGITGLIALGALAWIISGFFIKEPLDKLLK